MTRVPYHEKSWCYEVTTGFYAVEKEPREASMPSWLFWLSRWWLYEGLSRNSWVVEALDTHTWSSCSAQAPQDAFGAACLCWF